MPASDLADWWDEQKRDTESLLEEWVVENPQWWAIGGATALQTSMDLGQGFVDVLRLGQGAAEGGWGFGKDALRVMVVLGPLARAGGMLSRALVPLARAGNLRMAVQVQGVTGPCTFQAVNNALSLTRKQNLFLTVRDIAKAIGTRLPSVARTKDGTYKIAAFVDDLIPAIKATGGRVREVKGLSKVDDLVRLARRETGPVIFAFRTTVRDAAGVVTDIPHSVIAFRTSSGAVRFADYGGKFVNSLDELITNLGRGTRISDISLMQKGMSGVVVDGAWLTGEFASKLANGSILVLEGLAAIETSDNGVEIAVPVSKAAVREKPLDGSDPSTTVPTEVLKGSFEKFKERRKSGTATKLPSNAMEAGKKVAPRSDWLTGVQFRLNALGFASGPVDGIMGPLTRGAVIRFQRAYPPLSVDGIPGPKTQARLVEACGY